MAKLITETDRKGFTAERTRCGDGRASLKSTFPHWDYSKFYICNGWDYAHVGEKGGELIIIIISMTKDGASALSKHVCNILPIFTLGWRLNIEMRQNLRP